MRQVQFIFVSALCNVFICGVDVEHVFEVRKLSWLLSQHINQNQAESA
jgi:hypothetical protein